MATDEMEGRIAPQSPNVATPVVLAFTFGFLGFAAAISAGLLLYLHIAAPRAFQAPVETRFPSPALQVRPQSELKEFAAEQRASLSGYHWLDRAEGRAQIPVDEAMKIIVSRGAQAYAPLDPASNMPTDAGPSGRSQ